MRLNLGDLQTLRTAFAAALNVGLTSDGQPVAALPAHVRAPERSLHGRALVVDTGGTNMRAAVVAYQDGVPAVEQGPVSKELPVRSGEDLSAAAFFDAQAALTDELSELDGLPLGYCFSYPSATVEGGDAQLLRWTKGIEIPKVAGTLVGYALAEALRRRGVKTRELVVINDTVAALLAAGVHQQVQDSRHAIGLIVGTGTNMAAHFDSHEAPKLGQAHWSGPMAINLESGNFTPPALSPADDAVDAASENPGQQRFEKAVSGHYLPFIFSALRPKEAGFDPAAGSKQLSEFKVGSEAAHVASALLDRSADMIAAGLVAVVDQWLQPPDRIDVLADGSLFWKTRGYRQRVETRANELWSKEPSQRRLIVHQAENANLLGAAAAVLNRSTD